MNLSNLGLIVSLLFAPTFVIAMYFFEFTSVAFFYTLFMLFYLIVSLVFKQDLKSISTPLIYFVFVLIAYMLSSMEFVKMIPALISFTFFMIFFLGFIRKKELILSFTKKFYKKDLDSKKEDFLRKSDGYWALVIFLNTLIQVVLVYTPNNELWAFYSSVGWYIYLAFALILQIVYEKIFIKAGQR